MAAKKRKKRQEGTDDADAAARRKLIRDGGGYDWGWPTLGIVSANAELIRRLGAGGFVGCGYGLISEDGPPFIALVGENVEEMKSALSLMQEWVDVAGPNAVTVEILLDGPGYIVSISQQPDLLRWRLSGLNTTDRAIVMTMSISKRLDTRHPFLEQLADYSREPIAPIVLTVAAMPPSGRSRSGKLDTSGFQPVTDGSIMLPGISVYAKPEARPRNSMIMLESEVPPEPELGWISEPANDPVSVARERNRRLLATMPKTMHMLRQVGAAKAILEHLRVHGCVDWQIEQAICNLRIAEYLPYQPRSTAKRLSMLDQLRNEVVEHASLTFEPRDISIDAVLVQIALDTTYLIRRLDENREPPADLAGGNARLRELGYA